MVQKTRLKQRKSLDYSKKYYIFLILFYIQTGLKSWIKAILERGLAGYFNGLGVGTGVDAEVVAISKGLEAIFE